MRNSFVFVITLLAGTVYAQTNTGAATSACGPANQVLKVKTTDDATIPDAAPGMAQLVIIEDQLQLRPGHAACISCATRVQIGMDGQWIAATHGFSHTTVSVAPGDHHFCSIGSEHIFTGAPLQSMYGLHLDAGKIYFLRARLWYSSASNVAVLDLEQINEDEGRYLVSASKRATFTK